MWLFEAFFPKQFLLLTHPITKQKSHPLLLAILQEMLDVTGLTSATMPLRDKLCQTPRMRLRHPKSLPNRLAMVVEMQGDAELTNSQADLSCDRLSTHHSNASAAGVPDKRTKGDPPVVVASSHSNRSDLTAITPLAQESHHKGLHPRRAQQQRE